MTDSTNTDRYAASVHHCRPGWTYVSPAYMFTYAVTAGVPSTFIVYFCTDLTRGLILGLVGFVFGALFCFGWKMTGWSR